MTASNRSQRPMLWLRIFKPPGTIVCSGKSEVRAKGDGSQVKDQRVWVWWGGGFVVLRLSLRPASSSTRELPSPTSQCGDFGRFPADEQSTSRSISQLHTRLPRATSVIRKGRCKVRQGATGSFRLSRACSPHLALGGGLDVLRFCLVRPGCD